MRRFLDFMNQFSSISDSAWNELTCVIQIQEYNKGELITDNFRICNKLYFTERGLVKLYFINSDGKHIILRFFKENSVFTSIQSFLTQQPTAHIIKTIEITQVLTVEKKDFERLCTKHHCLSLFYQKFLEQININMLERITELLKDDAKLRYSQFIENNPNVAQRISLGDMADYLGITQVSLSRIRAVK